MNLYRTKKGETLSFIAWKHYGQSSGYVEEIINANPNLALTPLILPAGLLIQLPIMNTTAAQETQKTETLNLWT